MSETRPAVRGRRKPRPCVRTAAGGSQRRADYPEYKYDRESALTRLSLMI